MRSDFDRAIADYTQAIELDPKFALAYNNRGIAYRAKGDNDRAIADHTQAMQAACGRELQQSCSGVQPGGGRLIQCHASERAV